jgi:hypothetical protein
MTFPSVDPWQELRQDHGSRPLRRCGRSNMARPAQAWRSRHDAAVARGRPKPGMALSRRLRWPCSACMGFSSAACGLPHHAGGIGARFDPADGPARRPVLTSPPGAFVHSTAQARIDGLLSDRSGDVDETSRPAERAAGSSGLPSLSSLTTRGKKDPDEPTRPAGGCGRSHDVRLHCPGNAFTSGAQRARANRRGHIETGISEGGRRGQAHAVPPAASICRPHQLALASTHRPLPPVPASPFGPPAAPTGIAGATFG